jgi:hypothetical protein
MTKEEALNQALRDNHTRAGRETGYWGHYFLRELRRKGGLATAQAYATSAPRAGCRQRFSGVAGRW